MAGRIAPQTLLLAGTTFGVAISSACPVPTTSTLKLYCALDTFIQNEDNVEICSSTL